MNPTDLFPRLWYAMGEIESIDYDDLHDKDGCIREDLEELYFDCVDAVAQFYAKAEELANKVAESKKPQ